MSDSKKIQAKCINNDCYKGQLTIGKIYEVEETTGLGVDSFYKFIDDQGEMVRAWQSRFEVVSGTQVDTTPQFKTGDRVRVTGNSNMHNRKIGDICYLVELQRHGDGYESWSTSTTQGGAPDGSCWIRPTDMGLLSTVSTSVDNTSTEFKVGDKVKIRKDSEYYGRNPIHNPADKVGVIIWTDPSYEDHLCIRVEWPEGATNIYGVEDLELVEQAIIPEPEPEIPSRWANVEIGYY